MLEKFESLKNYAILKCLTDPPFGNNARSTNVHHPCIKARFTNSLLESIITYLHIAARTAKLHHYVVQIISY